MTEPRILRIYLDDADLARARKGDFNVFNRIRSAFEKADFRVEYCRNSPSERQRSADRNGYSLFHMDEPFHERSLTIRRAYFYPFWRIEKSAERWNWDVARALFDPDAIDPDRAAAFATRWRRKILGREDVPPPNHKGPVHVPLQGRLLEWRSFQSMSPMAMLETILRQDPVRQVVATLHPREAYLPDERAALAALAAAHPRLSIEETASPGLLARCAYVATQNSSVALQGYFLHRPAALFARIDFHHIAANVHAVGAAEAISAAPRLRPDYQRYLFWFLQMTAINAGRADAEDRILETVRRHGWPV